MKELFRKGQQKYIQAIREGFPELTEEMTNIEIENILVKALGDIDANTKPTTIPIPN